MLWRCIICYGGVLCVMAVYYMYGGVLYVMYRVMVVYFVVGRCSVCYGSVPICYGGYGGTVW